jgi:inhibitor of cysteine peptidase
MCTQALVPFEERVDLDVQGLPAGTYTVDVNGISDTFTFDADNEIPEE